MTCSSRDLPSCAIRCNPVHEPSRDLPPDVDSSHSSSSSPHALKPISNPTCQSTCLLSSFCSSLFSSRLSSVRTCSWLIPLELPSYLHERRSLTMSYSFLSMDRMGLRSLRSRFPYLGRFDAPRLSPIHPIYSYLSFPPALIAIPLALLCAKR
jgi:hypothetical protein